jgi:hypothetical protein
VPSNLDEVLEELFKEMEEQHQDSHCVNSDSDDNSDVANTNHSRPLTVPSHKKALQCVSQLITYFSAHQPEFMGYLFHRTTVLSRSRLQLRCRQDSQQSMNIFHQMNKIIVAEFQIT